MFKYFYTFIFIYTVFFVNVSQAKDTKVFVVSDYVKSSYKNPITTMKNLELWQEHNELLTNNDIGIAIFLTELLLDLGYRDKATKLNEKLLQAVNKLKVSKQLLPHHEIELGLLEARILINDTEINTAYELLRRLETKIIDLKLTEQEFKLAMLFANIYSKQADFTQVAKFLLRSYRLAVTLDNHYHLALVDNSYLMFYQSRDQSDKAIVYGKKATNRLEENKINRSLTAVFFNLSLVHIYLNQPNEAMQYIEKMKKIAITIEDNKAIFFSYISKFRLFYADKAYQQAYEELKKAQTYVKYVDIYHQLDFILSLIKSLMQLKEVTLAQQAINDFDKLVASQEKIDYPIYFLLLEKSNLAELKKDYVLALSFLKQYQIENMKEIKRAHKKSASQQTLQKDIDRTELENKLMSQESEITQKNLHDERVHKHLAWLLIFIAFVVITLLLFWLWRQKKVKNHIKKLAEIDPMTKLSNRRFLTLYEGDRDKKSGDKKILTAILFDIDKFKGVNDTHGHDVGDLVITSVANIASTVQRTGDVIARIGGEEFLILFENTNLEIGMRYAERLRVKIAKTPIILTDNQELSITASFGVAVASSVDESVKILTSRADDQMYRAKKAGRNQVCG
jgi:diguanylate cyclase (GGDEF)-like protein